MALSDLFSPLEWVFVIILGLVPLAGIVLHVWIMLLRPAKDEAAQRDRQP